MALTAGPRSIQSGNEYNHLFPKPTYEDPIVNRDGSVDDTLVQMAKIAQSGAAQVAQLAVMLAGADNYESCKNVHDFVVKYIQYAQDKSGVEQLRTPARTWADRGSNKGVDCDCMSIFESALLRNMQIPHYFRVVAFGSNDFEHVYVVVPRNGNSLSGGKIILDGVIHQFDREKPFTKHQDYTMSGSKLQMLNGIPMQVLNGPGENHDYLQHESVEYNEKLRAFLIAQREMIDTNRTLVQKINPQLAIENINYALSNWNNAHNRLIVVQELAKKEAQYHMETYLFRSILAFFEGKAQCSQVCASGYVQLPAEKIMQIQNNSLSGLNGTDYLNMHKGEHIANKVLLAGPRGAFLAVMRLNVFGWAEKLAPAFFPVNLPGESTESSWFYGKGNLENRLGTVKNINYNQQYTRIFGLSASQHLTARKKMFDYVLRRWWNMGGDWDNLKVAILKGAHNLLVKVRPLPGYQYWCKYDEYNLSAKGSTGPKDITPTWKEVDGLSGPGQLGEVVAAAIITAAAAVIGALAPFVAAFTKPSGATIDPNTGLAIPTNPTSNPDPTGHPNAALNPNTGLWTDTQKNQIYNPLSGQWESNATTSNTKKILLYVLAAAGIGYGIYSLIPEDKPKKQIANGK